MNKRMQKQCKNMYFQINQFTTLTNKKRKRGQKEKLSNVIMQTKAIILNYHSKEKLKLHACNPSYLKKRWIPNPYPMFK